MTKPDTPSSASNDRFGPDPSAAMLEAFFAAERAATDPDPQSGTPEGALAAERMQALMARVLADADRLQPVPAASPVQRQVRAGRWWRFSALWSDLAPAGGLGLAALAGGLWIGLAGPDLAQMPAAGPLVSALSPDSAELFPGDGESVASFTFLSES